MGFQGSDLGAIYDALIRHLEYCSVHGEKKEFHFFVSDREYSKGSE